MVLCPTLHQHERELALLDRLMHGTTDGAVLMLPEESNDELKVLRRKGYHAAMAEAGIPADPDLLVESGFVEEGGAQAMDHLLALKNPPTAIFAVTDMTAIGAYGAARRRGLRIPQDLAIVGYNDIPLAGRLVPGLTTVHVPIHEFGSVAARMLLEQIETGVLTPRRVVFAPQLVIRGSSCAGADEQQVGRPAPRSPSE